jgi:TP901 family phage tail tape measure protein
MADRDLTLAVRMQADATRFVHGITGAERGVKRFGQSVKNEFAALKNAATSLQGMLAGIGLGVGTMAALSQSARLDKGLIQTGIAANATREQIAEARKEMFRFSKDTGQSFDDLRAGFDSAIAGGLQWRAALKATEGVAKVVTIAAGASASDLQDALTVGANAWKINLEENGNAAFMLDQMAMSASQARAELRDFPALFARTGEAAAAAGLSTSQAMAMIEVLSNGQPNRDRLGTLTESTLRLFNTKRYADAAQKATGVSFYTKGGAEKRNPVDILIDIKKQYDKLNTERARDKYLDRAFGKSDLDTIKGVRALLADGSLEQLRKWADQTEKSAGLIDREFSKGVNNAVDQTGRLKNTLREAADSFAQPINDSISRLIKYGLDKKDAGGLELSGGEIIGGGVGLAFGAALAGRYGPKLLGGLTKRFGSTAAGVAEGAALEAATGVQPVFVVNWPATLGIGGGDLLGTTAKGGGLLAALAAAKTWGAGLLAKGAAWAAPAMATAATYPVALAGATTAAAGATGYGINRAIQGTAAGDALDAAVTRVLAALGHEGSQMLIAAEKSHDALVQMMAARAQVDIHITDDGRVRATARSTDGLSVNIDNGRTMVQP